MPGEAALDAAHVGIKRYRFAAAGICVAAVLYAVSSPPYGWSFTAWLAPGLLLASVRSLRPRAAFLLGVVFALLLGYGMTGWAVAASLQYFAFNRLIAWGFAVIVWLACGLPYALLTATYAAVNRRFAPAPRAALAAWLWVGCEWLRSTLFTGMPWELLGHTQYANLLVIQIADLGGVYAVSFVMVLVSTAVVEVAVDRPRAWARSSGLFARLLIPATALFAVLLYGYSSRAAYAERVAPGDPQARTVAVVQGNVPNAFRWKRAFFERTLATYANLTGAARDAKPELIVWPENAVNFYIDREPPLRAQLGSIAASTTAGLLVGGPRLRDDQHAHNSAYLIGAGGVIRATYDKQRLVPFAEYDPFARSDQQAESKDVVYMPGEAAAPIPTAIGKVGAIICYEVLFPRLVRDLVRGGAELLVNLSNDSWMDGGTGVASQQHFSMTVFRAVETRRYLIRAAASGVSGFVSPFGEPYSTLALNASGTTVAAVRTSRVQTAYVRWGDGWILAGMALVLLSMVPRRDRSSA